MTAMIYHSEKRSLLTALLILFAIAGTTTMQAATTKQLTDTIDYKVFPQRTIAYG